MVFSGTTSAQANYVIASGGLAIDTVVNDIATMQNQAAATVSLKTTVIERLLTDLPDGADAQVAKIRRSSLEAWLAKYEFDYPINREVVIERFYCWN